MSIYVAGFVMPQQATCNTASGSSREGKRAKSRSRSFGASKVLPLRNANIRAKDVRQASPKTTLCGGHNSSLPLASTTSSSPHCDRCLCHHSTLSISHISHRRAIIFANLSRVLTIAPRSSPRLSVLARPATIPGQRVRTVSSRPTARAIAAPRIQSIA
jgi:hypothetical protein